MESAARTLEELGNEVFGSRSNAEPSNDHCWAVEFEDGELKFYARAEVIGDGTVRCGDKQNIHVRYPLSRVKCLRKVRGDADEFGLAQEHIEELRNEMFSWIGDGRNWRELVK